MGQRRTWTAIALGLLQLVVLVSLVARGPADDPRRAPVAVVAPSVVGAALTAMAEEVPGQPLAVRTLPSATSARGSVADGSSVAAVVVDLRREQDVLLLASANGADLNRSVLRLVTQIEAGYGRTVVVEDVVPTDDDGGGVYLLVGGCILLGFVVPILITWRRGPVAATLPRGLARLAIVGASSVAVGLLVAVVADARYDTGLLTWWLVSALTLAASAGVTLALEGLFGVLGIGVATALLVLTSAPLVQRTSQLLLPEPWATITPWLPHGASLDAARGQAYFGGAEPRPLLILSAWIVLSVMTLAVERRERARDAAVASDVGERG